MPDDGAQCCQRWRSGRPAPGLAALVLSPFPAPPHRPVARRELAEHEEGPGWGGVGWGGAVGRQAGHPEGPVQCKVSLLLSAGLYQPLPPVWVRGKDEEAYPGSAMQIPEVQ